MHSFTIILKAYDEIKKSKKVFKFISIQMCQYFNNSLHQVIWVQFYFFRSYNTAKRFQGEKSVPDESWSLISEEELLSQSDSSPFLYLWILILFSG